MSAFSDYVENKVIDIFLRGASHTGPAPFVALFTSNPTDVTAAALAAEATFVNYARQPITFNAGVDGVSNNAAQIDFPPNGNGTAVTLTHFGIFDAVTNGNLLFHAPLASSKNLQPGDVFTFIADAVEITVD